jgi:uncharacterized protein (DUF2235 family)
MSKNIVFCADGTWNGVPKDDGDDLEDKTVPDSGVTNVVKLFQNLSGTITPETKALVNEHEKVSSDAAGKPVQVAKYLHGVGDSKNLADKLLGGVFGIGVVSRIVRGYTFISRNYEAGDRIYITGFSRGAYTARALAGMIAKVGLLDRTKYDVNDKDKAYKLGTAAWHKSKEAQINSHVKPIGKFFNKVLDDIQGLAAHQLKDSDLIPNVEVEAVGVWDTVGSLGIPNYITKDRTDFYGFTNTALSQRVKNGFHAMAIDEARRDFPVTKWDARAGVQQVWFVGAHGDVGGGYASNESELSDLALGWMMAKFAPLNVQFANPFQHTPDMTKFAQAFHKPWSKLPFSAFGAAPRSPSLEDTYHYSVVDRWHADTSYRPFKFASTGGFDVGQLALDARPGIAAVNV